MNRSAANPARWPTTPFADSAEALAADLKALGAHLVNCQRSRGRWFALSSMVETAHAFMAPRLVTTLVAATVAIGVAALVF